MVTATSGFGESVEGLIDSDLSRFTLRQDMFPVAVGSA